MPHCRCSLAPTEGYRGHPAVEKFVHWVCRGRLSPRVCASEISAAYYVLPKRQVKVARKAEKRCFMGLVSAKLTAPVAINLGEDMPYFASASDRLCLSWSASAEEHANAIENSADSCEEQQRMTDDLNSLVEVNYWIQLPEWALGVASVQGQLGLGGRDPGVGMWDLG